MRFVFALIAALLAFASNAQADHFLGGIVGLATTPEATFTMPTTGIAHATGSILCHESTAPCSDIQWQVSPVSNGVYRTTAIVLTKNNTTTTNAAFRLWFYNAALTLTGIKDGDAYSPKLADHATRKGYVDCNLAIQNVDNVSFYCTPPNGSFIDLQADTTGKVHGWMQNNSGGSYTAANSEIWYLDLIGQPMSGSAVQ
jgi:hypothetical protein